jgi:uncharacterized protein YciI
VSLYFAPHIFQSYISSRFAIPPPLPHACPNQPQLVAKTITDKRQKKSQHFANLKPLMESGKLQMGGAVLTEVPKDDEPSSLQFAGSTIVTTASSKEEVVEFLKKDVYAQNGVWDVENVSETFSFLANPHELWDSWDGMHVV